MFRIRRISRIHLYLWLAALLVAVGAWASAVQFGEFKLTHPSGRVEAVDLPVSRTSPRSAGNYELDGNVYLRPLSPKRFHVTPDDEVRRFIVNGEQVDLASHTEGELTDFVNGFELDLSKYLNEGANSVTIHFWDSGGAGFFGLAMAPSWLGARWLSAIAALLLILPIIASLGRTIELSRAEWACYSLVIVGALIQVVTVFVYNPVEHIWSDPERHWQQGIDALRIDLMSTTDPILYQLYIGVLAKLTLKMPVLVAFYTSLLAVATPWVWYRFLRELQTSRTIALIGWAFFSLLPSWTSMYSFFMQETLLLPLLGGALWATWRCRREGTVSSFVLMVAFWIAAGLTRGIAIPMAAVCCTWLWLAQDEKWRKAALSSLLMILIMGPLTYRAYQTVGHFAPHGMGHLAAIYGMSGKREIVLRTSRGGSRWTHTFGSPSTGTKPFEPLSDWSTQRTGKVVVDVDLLKGSEDWDNAYEQVKMEPIDALWITKENLIFLFFASSWPDNNPERLLDNLNSSMRWLWAPAFVLVLIGMLLLRRRLRGNWMLPAVLLTWFIVQGLLPISVNEGRYRKPFEGLVVAQILLFAAAVRGRTSVPQTHYPPVGYWLKNVHNSLRRGKANDSHA